MSLPILSALLLSLAWPAPAASATRAGQSPSAVTLRFQSPPTGHLKKVLNVKQELTIDSVTYSRDGAPPVKDPSAGVVNAWHKVTFTDHYSEVRDGRPERVERTWGDTGGEGRLDLKLPGKGPKSRRDERAVLVSPLRGMRVAFTHQPDSGSWERAWVKYDGEEFWLADMRRDSDLEGLLPQGPVEPGAEWHADIEAVRGLLAPGGNCLITPRTTNVFSRSIEVGVGGDFSEILGPSLTGDLRLRYQGERQQDGLRLAVIEIELAGLHSLSDRTDLWRLSMPQEEKQERSQLLSTLLDTSLDAKGELTWDLDNGRLHRVDLAGTQHIVLTVAKRFITEGQGVEQSQASSFSGTLKLNYSAEPLTDEQAEADLAAPPPAEGH